MTERFGTGIPQPEQGQGQADVVVPNYLGTQTRYVILLNQRRLFVTMLGSSQAFKANEKVFVNIPPEEIV